MAAWHEPGSKPGMSPGAIIAGLIVTAVLVLVGIAAHELLAAALAPLFR